MTVLSKENPRVPNDERATVEPLGHGCYKVNVCYGFKDERDIPKALEQSKAAGLEIDLMETSYFVPWQTVIATVGAGMALWREVLYIRMARNARDAADYFKIPTNRVIELGAQVEI